MDVEWGALESAGVFEDAPDPDGRRELITYLAGEGLTTDELIEAHQRGGLLRAAGDRIIRPGAGALSLRDIADRLGTDVERVQRLWRSLGAIDPGPDVRSFSPMDLEMVAIGLQLVAMLGEQQGWALMRRYGALMERLVEATSSAVVNAFIDISVVASGSEVATAKVWTDLAGLVPKMGTLIDRSLRHQVESVRRYMELAADPSSRGGSRWRSRSGSST